MFPVDGEMFVDLLHNTGVQEIISQTFNNEVGQWYCLEFYLASPNPSFHNPRSIQVCIADEQKVFSRVASQIGIYPNNSILTEKCTSQV